MSESGEAADGRRGRLSAAVREVKNRAADREDGAVELKEAALVRLELLAAELAPVFAEVPAEVEFFDFAISSGLQPRLWIDAVAYVALARDRRTFQFNRDTRTGRVTVAESTAVAPIADAVTNYIAERIVERERALAGTPPAPSSRPTSPAQATPAPPSSTFRSLLITLAFGALFGLGLAAAVFWDRLAPILLNR